MSIFNKTLAALAILIFFGLGSFSVVLAEHAPSNPGFPQYVKFHGPFKDRLPQLDGKTLKTGMLIEEEGELPNPSKGQSVVGKTAQVPFQDCSIVSTTPIIFAPKVSTCILQSVLNL